MYYERTFNNVACDIVIDHVACESVSCCVIICLILMYVCIDVC